jgi:hypothetical protein
MKASIDGRVRNTTLPITKALLPLYEAVMNSFQAIEEAEGSGHCITICAERQYTLDADPLAPIDAFHVTDSGIGFTDTNYDSFQTVDSPYKAPRGGKGLGRFLWLKAFNRVEIASRYKVVGTTPLMFRQFSFGIVDDEFPCVPQPSNDRTPQTTVHLVGLVEPYIDKVPRQLDILAQQLIAHFLPLFLNPTGPTLFLKDASQEIDLRANFRDNFQVFATERLFTVDSHSFTLTGFRLRGALAHQHEMIYAANFREVIKERLANHLANLKNKLTDNEHGDFYYLAFVQSPLLDAKVNSERTDFTIPRDAAQCETVDALQGTPSLADFVTENISMKAIKDAALGAIEEDLRPFLEEINTQKAQALIEFVERDQPQYRPLLKHTAEFIDQISPQASKSELDMALHRQLYQRQVRLKAEGQRILAEADHVEDAQDYYARLQRFVEDENEIGKTALAQYVVHRRVILEHLQKALGKDPETGKYALEKTIHQLVFPMRATSEEVPFEQQNLWIIDERLTFHTFLSSDKALLTLPILDNDSESRPDLLMFDRPLAFSENGAPLQSLVVVEFKKPDRDQYRDEDPVSQVYRMVREIREGKMQDKSGRYIRPASNNIPAYCYIICDLTPPLEIRIQNMGGRKTPDNLGYYGFNEALNAYYEIISYTKLLDDAKKRNRILFEKLNLPSPE